MQFFVKGNGGDPEGKMQKGRGKCSSGPIGKERKEGKELIEEGEGRSFFKSQHRKLKAGRGKRPCIFLCRTSHSTTRRRRGKQIGDSVSLEAKAW